MDVYSYSRLTTFRKCPRNYEYRYVLRRPEAFQSIEAFLGNVVHETLAWLYQQREEGREPAPDSATGHFTDTWEGRISPRVKVIRRSDSAERRKAMGVEMVARYHHGLFARDRLRTLAVEEPFEVVIAGIHRYTGIADRVAVDPDGVLHIVDFKTTSRPPTYHGDDETLQLRSYGLATMRTRNVKSVRLSYQYLANDQEFRFDLQAPEAARTEHAIADLIGEVKRATSYPARPSALCSWCGYRDVCDTSGFATTGDRATATATQCPRCGGRLVRRNGRRGPFLGCENFPRCRYTRDP